MLFSWANNGDSYADLKRMIAEADARIEAENLDRVSLDIEYEMGYYHEVNALILQLTAQRPETDEELEMRTRSEMTADQVEIERLKAQIARLEGKSRL